MQVLMNCDLYFPACSESGYSVSRGWTNGKLYNEKDFKGNCRNLTEAGLTRNIQACYFEP
jgi:hypothetical protein